MVEVPFDLGQGIEPHPAIVLSSDDAIKMEGGFIGVMLTTSKKFDDEFTFEIDDRMINKPMRKGYVQARLHLLGFFFVEEVMKNTNYNYKITNFYFEQLVKQINRITFNIQI